MADGRLRSTALVLSQAYPEAVAGTPSSFSFSPSTDVFELSYTPNHHVDAPTVVFVPTSVHYPRGYCAQTTGAGSSRGGGATCSRWTTGPRPGGSRSR